MLNELESSKAMTSDSQRPRLQLRLIHLAIMVTMVAVAFGMRRWAMEANGMNGIAGFHKAPFWRELVLITFSILDGLLLTASSVVVVEAVRGNVKQIHPGYLFLAVGVLILFVEISSTLALQVLGLNSIDDGMAVVKASMSIWLIRFILQALMLMAGLLFDRWWWRVTSAVLVFGVILRIIPLAYSWLNLYGWVNGSVSFFEVVGWVFNIAIGLGSIAMLSSMVIDGVKKQPRDWPHWVGCVLLVLTPIAYVVISTIASRYLSPEEMF